MTIPARVLVLPVVGLTTVTVTDCLRGSLEVVEPGVVLAEAGEERRPNFLDLFGDAKRATGGRFLSSSEDMLVMDDGWIRENVF